MQSAGWYDLEATVQASIGTPRNQAKSDSAEVPNIFLNIGWINKHASTDVMKEIRDFFKIKHCSISDNK